jgi:hypothetical protein
LLLFLGLTACDDKPPTTFSGGIGSGIRGSTLTALVSPVGPPAWGYHIESFDNEKTNAPAYANLPGPTPGSPNGHPSGISFTNVQINAPGCTFSNMTPGFSFSPGPPFVLSTTNGSGSSKIDFMLTCDKTNGKISIDLIDRNGGKMTVGPLAGPQ